MKKWMILAMAGAGVVALGGLVGFRLMYSSYKVPAGSMLPTLAVGDHVTTRNGAEPERGAVMVFKYPEHPDQLFVKRVIGLPGDKIEVKQMRVFINDWEVPRCEVGPWEYTDAVEDSKHPGVLWLEHLGTRSYLVLHVKDGFASDYQGPFKVSDGQYFMLGDNRENSHDSRMWFGGQGGGVPTANLIGRVTAADETKLPPGAESLRAAFDACMQRKPPKTTP